MLHGRLDKHTVFLTCPELLQESWLKYDAVMREEPKFFSSGSGVVLDIAQDAWSDFRKISPRWPV